MLLFRIGPALQNVPRNQSCVSFNILQLQARAQLMRGLLLSNALALQNLPKVVLPVIRVGSHQDAFQYGKAMVLVFNHL